MGFGARLSLGFFLFSFSINSAFVPAADAAPPAGVAAPARATSLSGLEGGPVEDLIEDIERLRDYIPAAKNPALEKTLGAAEQLAKGGRYDEAGAQVLKIKFRLIADAFRELSYVQDFRTWKDLGFFPVVDKTRDLLHEVVSAIVHLHEDLTGADFENPNQTSALTRFITLQTLTSAMRLRQDSAAYDFNERAKTLSHKLLWQFLEMDRLRGSLGEASVEQVTQASEELGRLNAELALVKRRESIASSVLVLNQLKNMGPPKSGPSVIDYAALGTSIEQVEKQNQELQPDPMAWAATTSPYQGLFGEARQTDASQQFQILKLELARRILEEKQDAKAAEEIANKIENLARIEDQSGFWLRVEDIRAQMNRIAPNAMDPLASQADAETLARLAPDALQAKTQAMVGAYSLMLDKVQQEFDGRTTTWQSLNPWAQKKAKKSLEETERALKALARKVASTSDPRALASVAQGLHWLPLLCNSAVESAVERSTTSTDYASLISSIAMGFNGSGPLVTPTHVAELRRLSKIERSEGVYRAWVNKDTITTAALSAMLVGEAVSVIYTGGTSAAAMPATMSAIRALSVAGKTITWISRGVIAVSAGSNLVDRYRLGGWGALANMESAVDAMMVLSVLPRLPLVTPASRVATTRLGRMGQWMVRYTGQMQFSTTRVLGQLMIAYSGYQLVYANSISDEYRRMGVEISPMEIRARAMLGLATSALILYKDRQALAHARQVNPAATTEIESKMSLSQSRLSKRLKGMMNPYAAARDFYRVRPSWYRAVGGAAVGVGYVGMDYLFINEGMLLAHTNPDFNYMYQVEKANPFPSLAVGESGVAMVGISPLDTLLYFGAHAEFSHARERKLYGDRYQVENYESPEDFVSKLVRHAEVHGPIKYLKIMTHGRPGMLYSQRVELMGTRSGDQAVSVDLETAIDSGWIDKAWLGAKRDWIRKEARKAFAPDARVILWACLTGANFDEPKFGGVPEHPIHVGDEFLSAFGDSFLPEGGSIDASTRILIGLGSVFGSALRDASYAGTKVDNHYRPVVPLVRLDGNGVAPSDQPTDLREVAFKSMGPGFFEALLDGAGKGGGSVLLSPGDGPSAWDQIEYTAGRAKYMMMYMPQIWWKYGIMLEGPWWHKWYQHVDIAPTAD